MVPSGLRSNEKAPSNDFVGFGLWKSSDLEEKNSLQHSYKNSSGRTLASPSQGKVSTKLCGCIYQKQSLRVVVQQLCFRLFPSCYHRSLPSGHVELSVVSVPLSMLVIKRNLLTLFENDCYSVINSSPAELLRRRTKE